MMRHPTTLALVAASLTSLLSAAAWADDTHAASIKIYNTYCVQCHGVNRDGNGINSKSMSVKPRDHTDSKAMGDTPDATLFKAIKEGGLAVSKSVLMPKWGGVLNDDQIKEMVSYLRFVSKTASN
ncbi:MULTISPECIES: cytochrome c [Oxalobacteraceae]|jgi:cytochrome c oxidase cbb3-type subunit 3|uniref:c-type cytochrome n=1 Tax=Oxalobacteraceae TaxID=75682 RepID=UPI0010A59BC7|nr:MULTISPECIES: cytochrome c [Oxalobacteraceae]